MPTFARFVPIVILLLAAATARSQTADRYADWRSGAEQAEQEPIEEPTQSLPEGVRPIALAPELIAADEPPAAEAPAESAWQIPPATLRRLPFRFERAPANFDHSKVIRASATEAAPPEISRPRDPRPMPLKAPRERSTSKQGRSGLPSITTLMGSVAIVVGLFLIVAWTARRAMPKQPPQLPREAIEILGRQRFGGKQEVQLLRVGNKLLLVHVVPGHAETLTEITDPVEVDRLTGICYQAHPKSSSRSFHQTFEQFASDKTTTARGSREPVDKLDLSMFDGLGRSKTKTV